MVEESGNNNDDKDNKCNNTDTFEVEVKTKDDGTKFTKLEKKNIALFIAGMKIIF